MTTTTAATATTTGKPTQADAALYAWCQSVGLRVLGAPGRVRHVAGPHEKLTLCGRTAARNWHTSDDGPLCISCRDALRVLVAGIGPGEAAHALTTPQG